MISAHSSHRHPTILTIPGLNGSGPTHWQSQWEQQRADTTRVDLGMWDCPHRNTWVTKLDQAISTAQAPVILVAHSLGCIAVAWWAALAGQPYGWPVAGALLVAPADVDRDPAPREVTTFQPCPQATLPFPSIVVSSSNDPWVDADRAHSFAAAWGSHFVDIGAHGHINALSGLGMWTEGQEMLERLIGAGGESGADLRAPAPRRIVTEGFAAVAPPRG